jgi:hypothetical protein
MDTPEATSENRRIKHLKNYLPAPIDSQSNPLDHENFLKPAPIKKRTPLISTRFSAYNSKPLQATYHTHPMSKLLNSLFHKRLCNMRRLPHNNYRTLSHNHNLSTLRQLKPLQTYLLSSSS